MPAKSPPRAGEQGLIPAPLDRTAAKRHVCDMKIIIQNVGQRQDADDVLDMTADGRFIEAPSPSFKDRLISWALLVAGAGIAIVGTALAIWFALLLVPFIIAAGLIGYAAFRWYVWRLGQAPRR